MPNAMSRAIRGLLILAVTVSAVLAYLVPTRTLLEGSGYQWGLVLFGRQYRGAGLEGDLVVLLCLSLLAVIAFVAAWRGSRRTAGLLMLPWFAVHAATAVIQLAQGERFLFQGETLGVLVDLTWLFVGLPLLALAGALALAFAGRLEATRPAWSSTNTAFCALFALIYAIGAGLLLHGDPHGQSDAAGVVLILGSLVIANLALAPWRRVQSGSRGGLRGSDLGAGASRITSV